MTIYKVFYTNGSDVMVTNSALMVKKKQYRLIGINQHGLRTVKTKRTTGIYVSVVGAIIALLGCVQLLTNSLPDFQLLNRVFDSAMTLMMAGSLLIVGGLITFFALKPKYAVHISTAEGDNDVIVSRHREYILQIVRALNRAISQTVQN